MKFIAYIQYFLTFFLFFVFAIFAAFGIDITFIILLIAECKIIISRFSQATDKE